MSCGTKIRGRFNSWAERDELAERLEGDGESRIANSVRRGDCLSDDDLRRAENALDHQGLSKHFDYREDRCACRTDEDEDAPY